MRMTAGVVCPSIVIPTHRSPSASAGRPASRAMPTTAAAALSKMAREIGLIPRMSITECITSVSPSPTNGPKGRRPEAEGETISLGTPTGRAAIAAAPRRAPSAPPRHSAPSTRRSAQRPSSTARTPSCICSTAAPREPAARTASSSYPPARATSARGTSASQPTASPRMPESITIAGPPRARYAIAHVRRLLALGVERGDQRDPGRIAQTAWPTDSAAFLSRSIESCTYWS